MDAIVMAGGLGSRLGMGEKPCVELLGKPLVSYVVDALLESEKIKNIYVAVSPATPKTGIVVEKKYKGNVRVIQTEGGNYVKDMIQAVESARIRGPVMIVMSDLPVITPEIIDQIVGYYEGSDKPAMSVSVPISVCRQTGTRPDTVFNKDGSFIVPAGINVLDGNHIREEQEEFNLILEYPHLSLNVNTVDDLKLCKKMIKKLKQPVSE
ncbi:4-diphosphocytidyl-2C-methyl-D-erythritolsynthase [Methanosalsum zhilinae DSM 4017]|uniref:4-diphosphocytidyl-2C-methyl-D-erythritolsynthase n=1 Tax=Methanosalsum zhilinae (strain DSM 4017 / NBRC 107636 / OCM 62 / WeN5) TaxID=679901 RepID=F7XNI2_METZD|nr:NTP transferase domain-containing protein [Methanosalsum zhilinae]AEH61242.1 4-diphosphocytidyl-2C-methyl-D-erythritolsynthase [Methanosalsum zhilinae DSM 4017]